jgi:hypothetical protein
VIPKNDCITTQVDEDEYHRDTTSLSQSGARRLVPPSCPAKFKALRDNPPKPKAEYTFGHAAHRLVLGKGAEILEVDAPDWRSKAAREAREQAGNDIAPMLTHELAKARKMAEAVKAHPLAGPLFDEGHPELSIYHTDDQTGVRLRGRLDWLRLLDNRHLIVDFKTSTTAHPGEFIRKAADYGYHQQVAWYIDLVTAAVPGAEPAFLFVVTEKESPYLTSVVELDSEAITEGRRLNRQAIETYAECIATDTWPSYPNNDDVCLVSLPPWAFRRSDILTMADIDLTETSPSEGVTA